MSDFVIENGQLVKYTGNGGDVVIPDGVTTIGRLAFDNCKSLTSVIIPNSVTEIGEYVFAGCTNLTSVTIPESVKSIGEYAFSGCQKMTSVTIPDSVITIGNGAFHGCRSLTSITIPDSVTTIGWDAFMYCTSLKSVTIPDSVKTIGYDVFYGCTSLTNFTYHGLNFSLVKAVENISIDDILDMVENRNFSVKMNHDVKYSVIGSFFVHNPDDEPTIAYIKKNFAKMFRYLIDKNDVETVTAIVNSGKFLTKRNIDKMIDYTIEKERHEIYVLLLNYKAEKLGFKDIASQFKL